VKKVGQTHWKKEIIYLIYFFNVYVCVSEQKLETMEGMEETELKKGFK